MPASHETVSNRGLSGSEAKEIILADVSSILDRDGLLSPHIGFTELAYKITVELHMNNPAYPTHTILVHSKPKPIEQQPKEVKSFPLPQETLTVGTGDGAVTEERAVGIASTRTRKVTNPNKERIKRGMPITISAQDKSGHYVDKQVMYGKEVLGAEQDENVDVGVVDENVSTEKRNTWGWDK